jgi:AcrR family transcriptional regulator
MPATVVAPPRDRLVATARRVLEACGLEGLTLREIARAGGLSHGAPLRHFPSLATLLAAVGAQGFRELHAAVAAAVAGLGSRATPRERLAAAGRGYVGFAHANPAVFALMFRPERLDTTDADYATAGQAAFDQLRRLCADAQGDGLAPQVRTDQLAAVVWSSVHGLAQLSLHGALAVSPDAGDLGALHAVLGDLLLGVPQPAARRRAATPRSTPSRGRRSR